MKSLSHVLALAAVALLVTLSGCGQGKFAVKPAKGKVVAAGKPVTSGSVTFVPVGNPSDLEAGKPASGAIAEDGTFVLSTFNRFDGAIVGKHRVQYVGAEDEDSEEDGPTEEEATSTQARPAAQQKPQYVQNGEIIVEVTASGPNDFTIELQPGGK